jgi:drug/metabolite transporter (DMT)-like permease
MLWIPLTVAAAFLQNLRSLLQKRLTGALSVNGAAYVRFCYALPFAWLYLLGLAGSESVPSTALEFWVFCAAGAIGQVLATACLLAAFTWRSFAVSTALSKTEVVQTAVIGLLLLGDPVAPLAALGIGITLVGVFFLSARVSLGDVLQSGRGLILGLFAGSSFAVAAVAFRGAALALPDGGFLIRASLTLAVALTIQTLIMGTFLMLRDKDQLARVAAAWRQGIWVGACGAAASVGWFTAMTLETSALVRALGQVELVFALLTSRLVFRERLRSFELLGMATLVLGIYLLL